MDGFARVVCGVPGQSDVARRFRSRAYNARMKLMAVICLAAISPSIAGQLIDVGPKGETREEHCARVEQIKPNLVLSRTTRLSGRVIDASGAPLENSIVELRLFVSESLQTPVKKVTTDSVGYFDLATVAKGQYRLLGSPTRIFKQAEKLDCGDRDPCQLLITLRPSPTDQPEMFCPVK